MSVTISHLLFGVGGDVFDVNITGHFSVLGGFLFLVIFDIQEKVEVFFTEFFCEKFSKFTTTGLKQQTNSLVNCCLGSHYRSKCISQFENVSRTRLFHVSLLMPLCIYKKPNTSS